MGLEPKIRTSNRISQDKNERVVPALNSHQYGISTNQIIGLERPSFGDQKIQGARTSRINRGDAKPSSRNTEGMHRDSPANESSDEVHEVIAALERGARAILTYGGAGVGKSHLIRNLRARQDGGRQITVAPTGIAALTLGG